MRKVLRLSSQLITIRTKEGGGWNVQPPHCVTKGWVSTWDAMSLNQKKADHNCADSYRERVWRCTTSAEKWGHKYKHSPQNICRDQQKLYQYRYNWLVLEQEDWGNVYPHEESASILKHARILLFGSDASRDSRLKFLMMTWLSTRTYRHESWLVGFPHFK